MNEVYTDFEDVLEEQPKPSKTDTKRIFSSGAVRDLGSKEDYVETVSYTALQRFARYMTSKQTTYGKGNWRKGIPIDSYEQSLMRHIQKYFANKYEGANIEPEEDHLAAAFFNLQGIMHEEEQNSRKALDEPKSKITTGSVVLATVPSKSKAISVETDIVRSLREDKWKIKEIANMTGVSERTVYRRLSSGDKPN